MPEIGYALSSEEHRSNDLVRHAALAEQAGFTYGLISDHYHPWMDAQGQSPFVFSVLGGIANATERSGSGPASRAQRSATSTRWGPTSRASWTSTAAKFCPGTPDQLEVHLMSDETPRDTDELAPGTDPPGDTENLTAGEGLGSLNNDADQDPLLRAKGAEREAEARANKEGQPRE